jgi:hypothetical protein
MTKIITIRIEVPDGAEVRVDGGGSGKPFVDRGTPAYPDHDPVCQVHGTDWKLIPAGVSKRTGNRYNAFYTCPAKDCNEKPSRGSDDQSEGY